MNRKDFEGLARAIKFMAHHADVTTVQKDVVACYLANSLEAQHANFDKAKFLKACGVAP